MEQGHYKDVLPQPNVIDISKKDAAQRPHL